MRKNRICVALAACCAVLGLTAAPGYAANPTVQISGGKWVFAADTSLAAGVPRQQKLTVTFLETGVPRYSFHVESIDADADNVLPGAGIAQHGCLYASGNTDTTTMVCNIRDSSTNADVGNLRVQGGDASDTLKVNGRDPNPRNGTPPITTPIELVGGDGGDTLENATLAAPATHEGGAGNDHYVGSSQGPDTFIETLGNGTDDVNYGYLVSTGADVSLDGVANDGRRSGGVSEGDNVSPNIENIAGSLEADILRGNADDNVLDGSGGPDTLVGNGGADVLHGATGDDGLEGGPGPDTFSGGDGS